MASALAWSTARAAFSSPGTWKVRLKLNRCGLVAAGERERNRAHRLERGHVPVRDLARVTREVRDGAVVRVCGGDAHGGVAVGVLERDAGHAHSEARGFHALLRELGEKHVVHVGVRAIRECWRPALVLEPCNGACKRGAVKGRGRRLLETEVAPLVAMTLRFFPAAAGTSMLADVQPSGLPLFCWCVGGVGNVPLQGHAILAGNFHVAARELRCVDRRGCGGTGEACPRWRPGNVSGGHGAQP